MKKLKDETVTEKEIRLKKEWLDSWYNSMRKAKAVPSKIDKIFAEKEAEKFAARKVLEIIAYQTANKH